MSTDRELTKPASQELLQSRNNTIIMPRMRKAATKEVEKTSSLPLT